MKRHQSLYPLSHNHHHALVQALNLDKAGAGDDQAGVREAAVEASVPEEELWLMNMRLSDR
jgi:hypothetical protein